jgi:hypothetical protein
MFARVVVMAVLLAMSLFTNVFGVGTHMYNKNKILNDRKVDKKYGDYEGKKL